MKRIDFENGTVTRNIFGAALPMLVAQILNLLYNIVDRIYIARIPDVGTAALGAVGLCFPLIVVITALPTCSEAAVPRSFLSTEEKKQRSGNRSWMPLFPWFASWSHSHGYRSSLRPALLESWSFQEALVCACPHLMIYLTAHCPQ